LIPKAFIPTTDVVNLEHPLVRIAYPGSSEVFQFQQLGLNEKELVEHVLLKGKTPPPTKRDGCDSNGIVRRINLGYGQEQGTNSTNSVFVLGHCLPFLDKERVGQISTSLRSQIGRILSLSQELLIKFYPHETQPPFYDARRTELFGEPFAALFSPQCTSRFEFVDLFLESQGDLNRHMDYLNDDENPGYQYVASYSYLFYLDDSTKSNPNIQNEYKNRLYRMNIIMASRRQCGRKYRIIHPNN
jgi:hypothetical protein